MCFSKILFMQLRFSLSHSSAPNCGGGGRPRALGSQNISAELKPSPQPWGHIESTSLLIRPSGDVPSGRDAGYVTCGSHPGPLVITLMAAAWLTLLRSASPWASENLRQTLQGHGVGGLSGRRTHSGPGPGAVYRGSPPSVSSPGSCPEAPAAGEQGWCLLGQPRSLAERWQEV